MFYLIFQKGVKTGYAKNKFKDREKKIEHAYRQAARSEMLMNEEEG